MSEKWRRRKIVVPIRNIWQQFCVLFFLHLIYIVHSYEVSNSNEQKFFIYKKQPLCILLRRNFAILPKILNKNYYMFKIIINITGSNWIGQWLSPTTRNNPRVAKPQQLPRIPCKSFSQPNRVLRLSSNFHSTYT